MLMEYARHEVRMSATVEGAKGTQRDHLKAAAAKGNKGAIKALKGPEFPEALAYLWRWARELHCKSGVGMSGFLPLTYTTIADWSRLTGNNPRPYEVEALFALDAILLSDG